jgi:hypothetical protein
LIGAGANLNATNAAGESALLRVLSGRTFETVAALIAHHPSLEIAAHSGEKATDVAVRTCNSGAIAAFAHARRAWRVSRHAQLARQFGADDGGARRRVVAIRLEAGADAGLRNKSRQNARDIARAAGRTAIAEMMK